MTYTLIDSVTLGSSASSVTFSGISATGKGDLVCVIEASHTETSTKNILIRFNNDSGSNYSYVLMDSDLSSYGGTGTNFAVGQTSSSATRSLTIFQAMDFSATDKQKSIINRLSKPPPDPGARVEALAGRWANTSAITTVNIISTGTMAAGSTFQLFQIVSE